VKTKKNTILLAGVASVALLSGCATVSETPVGTAYLVDASGEYVTNASGECWRTPYWTEARASEHCDPHLFARASEPAPEPEPEPAPPPAEPKPEPESGPSFMSYDVQRGDSLWKISGKSSVYGNPYQWPLIYRANVDRIRDADLIYPGQQLRIERDPASADVDDAVRHARTRGAWQVGPVERSDGRYLDQYGLSARQ
jgi:hypothetical protein